MKVEMYFSADGKEISIQLDAENQKEAHSLVRAVRAAKRPVNAYGNVGEGTTWAMFEIPARDGDYSLTNFNNKDKKA